MKVIIWHEGFICGMGEWDGQQIVDCPAVLPEEVYDALDAALAATCGEAGVEVSVQGPDGSWYTACLENPDDEEDESG